MNEFLRMDAYSASMAFVDGKVSIRGDLFSAIRHFLDQPHHTWRDWLFSALARLEHFKIASVSGARQESARNIQFHYDLSNDFYALFLDSRMIYSAAHFADPERSLEEAQTEKLDRICRSLDLKQEDRFLDIGCGWGGLVCYAVEQFGVSALGCTLSRQQLEFARELMRRRGIADRVDIELLRLSRPDRPLRQDRFRGHVRTCRTKPPAGIFQEGALVASGGRPVSESRSRAAPRCFRRSSNAVPAEARLSGRRTGSSG